MPIPEISSKRHVWRSCHRANVTSEGNDARPPWRGTLWVGRPITTSFCIQYVSGQECEFSIELLRQQGEGTHYYKIYIRESSSPFEYLRVACYALFNMTSLCF